MLTSQIHSGNYASVDLWWTPAKHSLWKQPCDIKNLYRIRICKKFGLGLVLHQCFVNIVKWKKLTSGCLGWGCAVTSMFWGLGWRGMVFTSLAWRTLLCVGPTPDANISLRSDLESSMDPDSRLLPSRLRSVAWRPETWTHRFIVIILIIEVLYSARTRIYQTRYSRRWDIQNFRKIIELMISETQLHVFFTL